MKGLTFIGEKEENKDEEEQGSVAKIEDIEEAKKEDVTKEEKPENKSEIKKVNKKENQAKKVKLN